MATHGCAAGGGSARWAAPVYPSYPDLRVRFGVVGGMLSVALDVAGKVSLTYSDEKSGLVIAS